MVKSTTAWLTSLLVISIYVKENIALAELAKEGSFDILPCYSGDIKYVNFDKEHIGWGFSADGPVRANKPEGAFDMMWQTCVGSGAAIEGKRYLNMSCEYRDKEGDKLFMRQHYIQQIPSGEFLENQLELFAGTGKYEGIKGEGEFVVLNPFPEDIPDKFWVCSHWKGSYRLP